MRSRVRLMAALFGGIAFGLFPATGQITESPDTMPAFAGRDETFGYCIGCHSMRVVGRQGMDRIRWDATLTWMTEKHRMPEPDAEMRELLLSYLEQAYPPAPAGQGAWTSPFAPQR